MKNKEIIPYKMVECKSNNPPIEIKNADEWLKENYKLMRHCLLDSGFLQFNEWAYDFRPYLKRFLYKFKYGVWKEAHAPQKIDLLNYLDSQYSKLKELQFEIHEIKY